MVTHLIFYFLITIYFTINNHTGAASRRTMMTSLYIKDERFSLLSAFNGGAHVARTVEVLQ